jgi:histone acetyltransferase (RNA polymerase elongator complex component)
VLVIKGTELEDLYLQGDYKPLLMDEAVAWSKEVFKVFEKHGVRVIRMGLHPSDGLITGEELTAGPFHQSFRELVMTALWWDQLKILLKEHPPGGTITIIVHPKQLNFAIGYEARNKKRLLDHFRTVVFQVDDGLMGRAHNIERSNK